MLQGSTRYLGLAVLLLTACSQSTPSEQVTPSATTLLYDDTFDSGRWSGAWGTECPFDYSCSVVQNPQGDGSVMRFEHRKGDYDGSRETKGAELKTVERTPLSQANEFWYGFKVYFPEDGMRRDVSPDMIAQWHGRPDFDKGEDWRNPIAFLDVRNDDMTFSCAYSPKEVNVNEEKKQEVSVSLGKVPKSRWVSFVFHIKFDPFGDGIVEMWQDGKSVLSRRGVGCGYNDELAPYFKYGFYKYSNRQSDHDSRVIFFDDVRVGDSSASYNDVMPGGGGPTSPAPADPAPADPAPSPSPDPTPSPDPADPNPRSGVPIGQTVWLKAQVNDKFVGAPSDAAPLLANGDQLGVEAQYQVVEAGNGKVALRNLKNGKYVAAVNDRPLYADGNTVGSEDRYIWQANQDGTVCFRSEWTGQYVVAEDAGSAPLTANRDWCRSWERFTWGVVE